MLNLSADLNHHRARPVIGPAHGATRTRAHLFFRTPHIGGDHSTSNIAHFQPPGLREIRGHGSLRKQCEELMPPLSPCQVLLRLPAAGAPVKKRPGVGCGCYLFMLLLVSRSQFVTSKKKKYILQEMESTLQQH
ncbi:hypothetical protein CCHR01_11750 [Colletotrichum chrysophilum]|uniref:Uncharacterized protein n=1 Tax=Colletotrichum chrysophilum TaxID=1836956 RepID=A0AAD9ACH9_9PEZI|nr:hypothetical protein CCHR01_11750 [Colletotrichum chrysophilum]